MSQKLKVVQKNLMKTQIRFRTLRIFINNNIFYHIFVGKNTWKIVNKINNEIDNISKTKSRTKKNSWTKKSLSDQSQSSLKIWPFWNIYFFVAVWLSLWPLITQKLKIGKIWYMILHSIQHYRNLSWNIGPLLRGEGLLILSREKSDTPDRCSFISLTVKIFSQLECRF